MKLRKVIALMGTGDWVVQHFGDELEYLPMEEVLRVAYSPHLIPPSHILEELARHPNYEVRRNVAFNPATPMESLWQLAMSDPGLLIEVAANDCIPVEWLEFFAHNYTDVALLAEIAGHPKTPQPVLQKLSQHQHWQVQQSLAKNPNLNGQCLARVYNIAKSKGWSGPWWFVGNYALNNPSWRKAGEHNLNILGNEIISLLNQA